jgi:hypothetical protein
VQAYRAGYNPGSQTRLGWFGALHDAGLLDAGEALALGTVGDFMRAVEKETFTKSYKLVTLQEFLDMGGVTAGVDVRELAVRCRQRLAGSPDLAAEVSDHLDDSPEEWERYWRKWPIAAWIGDLAPNKAGLFRQSGDRFELRTPVPEAVRDTVEIFLREWADYRLCRYVDRNRSEKGIWRLKVLRNSNGNPIVWLDRPRNPGLPEGEAELVIDGETHIGVFRSIALNVVRKLDGQANVLATVLRGWFGDDAGQPGSIHTVELAADEGSLVLRRASGRSRS